MAAFVTIYSSMSLSEIYVLKGRLEAEGIPSFTKDERLNQMAPYISSLSNGIQLQVRPDDLEPAVQILQDGGYIVPKVSKKDGFYKKAGLIFLVAIICEIAYLLHKYSIL